MPVGETPAAPGQRRSWTAPRVFAVLGMVYGLALVVVTPPFGSPDEQIHLARAYLISEGHFRVPGQAPGTEAFVPRSIAVLFKRMAHSKPARPPTTFRASELSRTLRQPLNPESRVQAGYLGAHGPVAYAPQALAVFLARIPEASPALLMYLGRLSNLLAYLVAGTLAIAWAPLRKWALCLLLLAPMPLAQAASLSADAPTNALAVLFTAAVWRRLFGQPPRIGRFEQVFLVLASALFALTKPGYWPLAALVLLIPRSRFRDRRERLLLCSAVLLAALLPSLLWLLDARSVEPVPASPDTDPEEQLLFILRSPIGYLRIALCTLAGGWVDYARTLVGVLGHLNIPLPGALYLVYPLALVAAAMADPRDPEELSPWRRIALAAIALACVGCVFTMAYLGWNPVGAATISGVQGRYFVPVLPLALLALPAAGGRLPQGAQAWGATALAALSLSLAVSSVWAAFFS
jgi:uncharacterized membrane protein